jgi:S-adenosylmethionine hydrolase
VPTPQDRRGSIVGEVLYVDHFGNLVSNIPADMLWRRWQDPQQAVVSCAGTEIGPPLTRYADAQHGGALALINSMGLLEVAVNQGRACDRLNAGVGAEVTVRRAEGG